MTVDLRNIAKPFVLVVFKMLLIMNCSNSILNAQRVTSEAGTFDGLIREIDVFGETRRLEKYLGIPYAEPPVGDRRFQKPELKAPLESPHDATQYGVACMQLNFPWGGFRNPKANIARFSEDCLYLNIHKPFIDTNKTNHGLPDALPVFVYIHGGGYVCGAAEMFNGDWLRAYSNVIVVTIGYRFAVWGFLSSGNDIAPGNLGLWDQHVALKWINQNIQAFGGDPNRVTISGQSAGSSSVVYQSLFPRNEGLFQRAIALEGVSPVRGHTISDQLTLYFALLAYWDAIQI